MLKPMERLSRFILYGLVGVVALTTLAVGIAFGFAIVSNSVPTLTVILACTIWILFVVWVSSPVITQLVHNWAR